MARKGHSVVARLYITFKTFVKNSNVFYSRNGFLNGLAGAEGRGCIMGLSFAFEICSLADNPVDPVIILMELIIPAHVGKKGDHDESYSHAEGKSHDINE